MSSPSTLVRLLGVQRGPSLQANSVTTNVVLLLLYIGGGGGSLQGLLMTASAAADSIIISSSSTSSQQSPKQSAQPELIGVTELWLSPPDEVQVGGSR